MADVAYSKAGDTVDLIAFRERGETADVTEAIFRLNPGLARRGVLLPAGVAVKLPPLPTKIRTRNVKRLWSR